jgi:hypothetical protein
MLLSMIPSGQPPLDRQFTHRDSAVAISNCFAVTLDTDSLVFKKRSQRLPMRMSDLFTRVSRALGRCHFDDSTWEGCQAEITPEDLLRSVQRSNLTEEHVFCLWKCTILDDAKMLEELIKHAYETMIAFDFAPKV